MRCALIEAEKASYPIAWMCDQLGVARSSFYAWRAAADTVTATAARRQVLAQLVKVVFDDSHGTYGCRRVAAELNRRGHPASVGLVADLMRELGLVACQPRSYKTTTVAGDRPVASPDLIEREFTAPAPGQRLVGSGSRREFHPPAPTEPCVIVSHYTAPAILVTRSCGTNASERTSTGILRRFP